MPLSSNINTNTFRVESLVPRELLRRLTITLEGISSVLRELDTDVQANSNAITALTSGNYTGSIYAMDSNNQTVVLNVVNGKVETIARSTP